MPVTDEGQQPAAESYAPFDPASVETHSGPPPSSTAPVDSTDPHPVTDSEDAGEKEEPLPEFDPRFRDEFEGLLFVGALTKRFKWLGHEFVIRTLTTNEMLEVGLLQKEYAGSYSEVKAYQAAVVAACVVTVDGKPLPMPLTNTASDTLLTTRFQFVVDHWFPPVLDVVYDQYLTLESAVYKVIEAMDLAIG